jgi:4-amino-4-deoxy-L-arabinose transferase-like glycosyltransferase
MGAQSISSRRAEAAVAVWRARPAFARLLMAGAALAVLGLHLFSLTRTPPAFNDEAWFTSHAWGLLQTGRPFGPLDRGVFEELDGHWSYFSWLHAGLVAPLVFLFGPSLVAGRLTALLFGLLLLAAVWAIARRLDGKATALVAVGLVALSNAFRYSSHLGRPDIVVAALGFGAIALCLGDADRRRPLRSLLAGLAIGLGFEMHPNALLYGPVVVALLALDHGPRLLASRRLWAFAGGAGLGLLVFAGLHLVRHAETYLAIVRLTFGTTKTPPLLDPGLWARSAAETVVMLLVWNVILTPLLLAGAIVLARRGDGGARRLLATLAVLVAGFLALVSYKPGYYAILITPAAELVLAAFLVECARWWRRGGAIRRLPAAAAWGATAIAIGAFGLAPLSGNMLDDYQASTAALRRALPAGSVVMGEPKYWFGLTDYPYFAWQQLTYYRAYDRGSSLETAIGYHRPDYLLVDAEMDWQITDEPGRLEPWAQLQHLPKIEWEGFLRRRATLTAVVPSSLYGEIRVYRIRWPEGAGRMLAPAGVTARGAGEGDS